jgi:hypothetical protein
MKWLVEFHNDFFEEFKVLDIEVQDQILAKSKLLEVFGHNLGRPHVDTLTGSAFSNMKELRVEAKNGVWRIAFAFDPKRKAILLVTGDKKGVNQSKFYKDLIRVADLRFEDHLIHLKKKK